MTSDFLSHSIDRKTEGQGGQGAVISRVMTTVTLTESQTVLGSLGTAWCASVALSHEMRVVTQHGDYQN